MSENVPLWAQDLSRSLGVIEGKIDTFSSVFAGHVAEDKVIAGKVQEIQLLLAQRQGATKVWGLIATGVASVAGASVHFLGKKFGW